MLHERLETGIMVEVLRDSDDRELRVVEHDCSCVCRIEVFTMHDKRDGPQAPALALHTKPRSHQDFEDSQRSWRIS